MAATAKTVKDVSPHEFVKAYSAHLKRSGKVKSLRDHFLCAFQFPLFMKVLLSFCGRIYSLPFGCGDYLSLYLCLFDSAWYFVI